MNLYLKILFEANRFNEYVLEKQNKSTPRPSKIQLNNLSHQTYDMYVEVC